MNHDGIDFAFTDKLNRQLNAQARRRKILWAVADIAAPAIIILAAIAIGWLLRGWWLEG
jgi:hypothetical protein